MMEEISLNYIKLDDEKPKLKPKMKMNRCCKNQFFWYFLLCIIINMSILITIIFTIYPLIFDFYEDYTQYKHKLQNTSISYDNTSYHLFLEFPQCKFDVYESKNLTNVYITQSYINTNTVYTIWYKGNECSMTIPKNLTESILMLYLTVFLGSFIMHSLITFQTHVYYEILIK